MKNLKFLLCSLLLFAFGFTTMAHDLETKKDKTEFVVKVYNTFETPIVSTFTFVKTPQAPQLKLCEAFVYKDVELWNYFSTKNTFSSKLFLMQKNKVLQTHSDLKREIGNSQFNKSFSPENSLEMLSRHLE